MNCDNCELEKNSLIALVNGLTFKRLCNVKSSTVEIDILCVTALAIFERPILNCVCKSSPIHLIRLFERLSISSVSPKPSIKLIKYENVAIISECVTLWLLFKKSLPTILTTLENVLSVNTLTT